MTKLPEFNYIHFEEIPSTQTCVRFKEHFYSTSDDKHLPTQGASYHRINLDLVSDIILDVDESDFHLVMLLGMTGKFFT
jgi:hypothetical protein